MHDPFAGTSLHLKTLPSSVEGICQPAKDWQLWRTSFPKKRPSAVMLLFARSNGDAAHLILTRRSTRVGSHKGQIALVGGRADVEDNDPTVTALRELDEELGVPSGGVRIHGQLATASALDGSPVVPILATTDVPPEAFRPAPDEVAAVIAEPWSTFARTNCRSFRFNLFGLRRFSHHFRLPGHTVWGLTARIIHDANLGF